MRRFGENMDTDLKIMIIDDDLHFLTLLRDALDTCGLRVKICENGVEAMLNTILEQYDYIVTDFQMPGMDGVELTRRLRQQQHSAIIIGMSGRDIGESFLRAGANDFLLKPFPPYRLAIMIDGGDILT